MNHIPLPTTTHTPRIFNEMVESEEALRQARLGDIMITEQGIGLVNGRLQNRFLVTFLNDSEMEIQAIKAWQLYATETGILEARDVDC